MRSRANGSSICRADVLKLDGIPIAVSLIAVCGRTGFAVKSAYDEAYRRYGIGILLEFEVIRGFLSGDWADRLDSATAGPHVLDTLWSGRIEVANLIFSLSPRHQAFRLGALRLVQHLQTNVRDGLKRGITLLTHH
jgi:Acetyltransferase (GNAT) domain